MESTNPKQDERIGQAIALHLSGRLPEAADRMRELLGTFPKDPLLLAHLGTIYLQQGNPAEGVRILEESIRVAPSQFMALSSYSLGLASLGRFNEALKAYDDLIGLQPGHAWAHNNRGAILQELKRPQDALESFDRAIALKPDHAEAHFNRANVLEKLGQPEEALESYDRAIAANPAHAWAHNNRGNALLDLHRPEDALASFDRAIALEPRYAEAHYNRANVLQELGRRQEALESFDLAIAANPGYTEAHYNQGNTLLKLHRPQEALESFNRAIAANPDFAEAYNNRGNAFKELHQPQEAFADYDRATALAPGYTQATFNNSLLKIMTGDYPEGWRLYESRWKLAPKEAVRAFTQPLWLGAEPLAGKTFLIHAEQGLGDALQFCRYVPMAEKLGAKIILEVPKRLVAVISTLTGNRTVVEKGKPLPPFDLHCPMLSLPLAFKTTLETVPGTVPYLSADPNKRDLWRKKLGPKSKPRIALAWSGKKDNSKDQSRSMALETLRPLLELPFEFHSLQLEYREKDLALLATLPQVKDHQKEQEDFSDAAALMAEVDLVLSVDTSVVHLAGALGKPVWVLLSYTPDHRWMLEIPDSPWYPTATLFRQPTRGDWKTVVSEVMRRLQREFLK